ncbi:MAG: exosome complex protein Rrp42 [Candidatus Thermoplasmatota archaeon]|nr:exosome complex protein Rrp42 [Candidatus Thermoplasmatota archaeon]
MLEMTEAVHELTRSHILRLAAAGKRGDGRGLEDQRPVSIQKGFVETAEGSARAKLGNTDILVGVKMEIGQPYPDSPDRGVLITNVELTPVASPDFESGPPRPAAIELARVVDRGIRETETVDMEKLCIESGEKVWLLFIDIHVLDYHGNLFDASNYAALAALTNTLVPISSKLGDGKDIPLGVLHYPVSVTVSKIGDILFVDPSLEEDRIADARLTVTTDEDGHVRAMQKGLEGSFTLDEVIRIISLSQKTGKKVRKTILEA